MQSRSRLTVALLLAASACTRVGTPAPGVPGVAESVESPAPDSLSGVVTLGGQRLRVVVALSPEGRGRGTAHLEIPDLPLDAMGAATWRDESLELDLRYAGDCPGQLRIRARRQGAQARYEGTLTAKDCTGEETGTVFLEARPPTQAPSVAPGRVESAAREV